MQIRREWTLPPRVSHSCCNRLWHIVASFVALSARHINGRAWFRDMNLPTSRASSSGCLWCLYLCGGCFALWCCYPCPLDWRLSMTPWTAAQSSGELLRIVCWSWTASRWRIILFTLFKSKLGSVQMHLNNTMYLMPMTRQLQIMESYVSPNSQSPERLYRGVMYCFTVSSSHCNLWLNCVCS